MKQYDYLVVGTGLFGAVFAQQAKEKGKKVLVIDKRPHIAGNIYTKKVEGIDVHEYGAHIFHTMIEMFGSMLLNLLNLIVSRIHQSPITMGSYILYHSTCTHLIKCGVL